MPMWAVPVRYTDGGGLRRISRQSLTTDTSGDLSLNCKSLLSVNGELTGSCDTRLVRPRVQFAESKGMYRVALVAALATSLGACSLNTGAITSGFTEPDAGSSTVTGSVEPLGGTRSGLSTTGSSASTSKSKSNVQLAALSPDKAPKGTFEKAPHGALADRDYSGTSLNPERARDLINQYRHEKKLKPLRLNAKLSEAAKEHSRDLAKWDRISHYGSDGSNPWDRVKRTGYQARLAAENVGTGQVSFEEVLRGWKESPGHNKNLLLSDAQEMGLALVQDPKTEFKSFWTLVIGSSM